MHMWGAEGGRELGICAAFFWDLLTSPEASLPAARCSLLAQGTPLPDGYAAPPDLKAIVDLALMRSAKVAEPVDLGSIAVDSTDEAEFAAVACQTQKDDQHLCA